MHEKDLGEGYFVRSKRWRKYFIKMNLSDITKQISPSPTRKLFDLASKYNDKIDFTLGDPDLKTPIEIRSAACEAIMDGKTRYSANAGLIELRHAVSKSILRRNNVYYNPECEIVVTTGAMEALYVSLLCLIDEGDEVIILSPYWINYKQMITMCHGKAIIVDGFQEENSFQISVDAIEAAITERTKAIIVNSPNNPSGVVYSREVIKGIAEIAIKHDLIVITDEVYRSLIYDGVEYTSILDFEGMKERTVLIYSFSKEFAMTGWRIGYAAVPPDLAAAMTKFQENIVACAPLPSQHALIDVLNDYKFNSKHIVEEFTIRRACVIEEIKKIPKLHMEAPQGTFYAYINISDTGLDSETFAYKLLESEHVAVVPGIAYGENGTDYIRIAFTIDVEKIKEGFTRIRRFVDSL